MCCTIYSKCSCFQDIFELYHNGKQTAGERVLSYEVGDDCITNMVGWPGAITAASNKKTAPTICLAVGLEEKCIIMKMKPTLRTVKKEDMPSLIPKQKEKGDYLLCQLRQI